jgi:ankyrin repeat protein
MRNMMMSSGIAVVLMSCQAYASMDVDTTSTNRVMEMIVDLGGHGSADYNGKVVPCIYRGTKKVSINRNGATTVYSGEYSNCRENGMVRDGIYTVIVEGEYIVDSTSQRSKNGELFDAVIAGEPAKVRKLIKAKADVNYTESIRNNDGSYVNEWSPLMSSVLTGKLEVMKLLVNGGAWVNYMNSRVVNSLWLAANNGQLDMVKFLAGKKANINNLDIENMSPLMVAAMNGHHTVAEYLIGLKADVTPRNNNGDNALMLAIQNGHTAIARLVIDAGSEINDRNRSGATALMIAVVEGNEEMVRLLLDKKADVTMKSDSGKTALDYAALKGNAAILELLKNAVR